MIGPLVYDVKQSMSHRRVRLHVLLCFLLGFSFGPFFPPEARAGSSASLGTSELSSSACDSADSSAGSSSSGGEEEEKEKEKEKSSEHPKKLLVPVQVRDEAARWLAAGARLPRSALLRSTLRSFRQVLRAEGKGGAQLTEDAVARLLLARMERPDRMERPQR